MPQQNSSKRRHPIEKTENNGDFQGMGPREPKRPEDDGRSEVIQAENKTEADKVEEHVSVLASPSRHVGSVWMRPEDKWLPGRPRVGIGGPHRCGDKPVVGGEVTDRVGSGSVAGQLECLAATSAEIDLAAVAVLAWIGHPACSPETLEEGRPLPDPCQRVLTHAGAGKGESMCGRTGEYVSVGHYGELASAPAAHTGFGVSAVVVGNDVDDLHPAVQPTACRAHRGLGALELSPARQEPVPVPPGPSVVLRVGQFDAVRL